MINTIILAGGRGSRLSEETEERPKPMVLLDSNPILWHIMKIYLIQGYSYFSIALGHKGEIIKKWLMDLHSLNGNLHLDFQLNKIKFDRRIIFDNLKISAIETGLESQTGGRILNCMKVLPKETVMATYGDGLGNININRLIEFHKTHKKLATVTAVRPPSRFGQLDINDGDNQVKNFGEKSALDSGWINGGFFVLEPEVVNYINDENEPFETGALPRLAIDSQLMAFKHEGFWMPMDTLRERNELRSLATLPVIPWLDN
jgi:glucose-1-phosphate cytidylyltransferase